MSKPVFEDLFTFSGRRNRMSYFLYQLALLAAFFVVGMLFAARISSLHDPADVGIEMVAIFVLIIPALISSWAVSAQRCRDFGWTGWAVLITAIPYIGWIFAIALLFIPGNEGANRYGPDPLSEDADAVPAAPRVAQGDTSAPTPPQVAQEDT